jgi:hypothetical protein
MVSVRRLVLDLLKPHGPDVVKFAESVAGCEGVAGVNVVLMETDKEVQNVKMTIEGESIPVDTVHDAVTDLGGTGESVFGTVGHEGVLFYVLVGLLAVPALIVSGATVWDDLVDIGWGTLLLLGGGISLANALADTNATMWLAEVTLGSFEGTSIVVLLLVMVMMTVLVGELASNTAMAASSRRSSPTSGRRTPERSGQLIGKRYSAYRCGLFRLTT